MLAAAGLPNSLGEVRAASPRARADRRASSRDSRDRRASALRDTTGSAASRTSARPDRGVKRASASTPAHRIGASVAISCERAGRQRREDAVLDAPERIADAALGELPAVLGFGRAGGHGQRTVDRLDDVGDRDRARRPATGGSRRACPGATSAGRAARAAAAPSPSARWGCRTARRSRARWPTPRRGAMASASSPSARSRLSWRVAAYSPIR